MAGRDGRPTRWLNAALCLEAVRARRADSSGEPANNQLGRLA